jgi:hypothetical protein
VAEVVQADLLLDTVEVNAVMVNRQLQACRAQLVVQMVVLVKQLMESLTVVAVVVQMDGEVPLQNLQTMSPMLLVQAKAELAAAALGRLQIKAITTLLPPPQA